MAGFAFDAAGGRELPAARDARVLRVEAARVAMASRESFYSLDFEEQKVIWVSLRLLASLY